MLSSFALLILGVIKPIDKITLSGVDVISPDETTLITAVFVMAFYFYYRYVVYYLDFEFSGDMKTKGFVHFVKIWAALIIPMSRKTSDYLFPVGLFFIAAALATPKSDFPEFFSLLFPYIASLFPT